MGTITLYSNIASLNAQRRLSQSTQALEQSYQKLSSGLRINRASDDAAGLAIAASLNTDARVFNQGIRNFNDGISLLNIAEGSLTQLSSIVIRIRELATQSANGTLANEQRTALNEEANALVEEYNRITQSSSYNNLSLLRGNAASVILQGGYGSGGQISISLGDELSRLVGTGTYTNGDTLNIGSLPYSVGGFTIGDLNQDGAADLVLTDSDNNLARIYLNQGQGDFSETGSYSTSATPGVPAAADLNNDGVLDLILATASGQSALLGNGDGTFRAETAIGSAATASNNGLLPADFNNDGNIDFFLETGGSLTSGMILFGNGNGTFREAVTFVAPDYNDGNDSAATIDFDGDGNMDVVTRDDSAGLLSLYFGRGDGTFANAVTIPALVGTAGILLSGDANLTLGTSDLAQLASFGDLNNDGVSDLITISDLGGNSFVILGNSDGTFQAPVTLGPTTEVMIPTLADINGDGILDFYAGIPGSGEISINFGNGDGTFRKVGTVSTPAGISYFVQADLDGNGTGDIFALNFSDGIISTYLSDSTESTSLTQMHLSSRAAALREMSNLDNALDRINRELGAIGSVQSRLSVAISNLTQGTENILASRSRIVDADIADESATLVKSKILQQAGAAILSQANQLPELALLLLRN